MTNELRRQTELPTSADVAFLGPDDPRYPAGLRAHLGEAAPDMVAALGDTAILDRKTLALFSSVRCPGALILRSYDLAVALRDAGVTVIGGFHSPMEQECLRLLLRGRQPVVVCPARNIDGMRLPSEWRAPLADGRLLLLSPFAAKDRRITAELAQRRNRFVAAIADAVFVAHAAPSSRTEAFIREILGWGKPVLTLASDYNSAIQKAGARRQSCA